MNASSTSDQIRSHHPNQDSPFLRMSVIFWFVVTLIGQWFMTSYILMYYIRTSLNGNISAWSEVLPNGIRDGEVINNTSLTLHIFIAFFLYALGPLQLIPQVRQKFLNFHKWNGRAYVILGMVGGGTGAMMTAIHGGMGGNLIADIGGYIDSILIFAFGYLTFKTAIKGDLVRHGRWALRLFMAVSATFFIRVGVMFSVGFLGALGVDIEPIFTPIYTAWSFGQYLVPLAMLEFYFYVKDTKRFTTLFSTTLLILTIAMIGGLAMTAMAYWIPLIDKY